MIKVRPLTLIDTLNIAYSIPQSPITRLKKLRGFRTGHLNVVSLTKYIDQLRIYMYDKPLDIFTLNVTRLDDNISDKYTGGQKELIMASFM